jgi:hypothetical protein
VSFTFLNDKNERSIITTIFASVVIVVFVAAAVDTSFSSEMGDLADAIYDSRNNFQYLSGQVTLYLLL